MPRFNTYLDYADLEPLKECCLEHGTPHVYMRGEKFVQEGEVCRYVGYVRSGYFKYATLKSSGEYAVGGFVFAGEFVTDFYNSFYGIPSEVSVIAGCDAEVLRVPMSAFVKLLENDAMLKDMLGALYRTIYHRYIEIYRYTTEERYIKLLSDHPDIFEQATLKDIASYLMISPIYLSRLRKKLYGNQSK
ncbi:MAG: Crp/Fnr family transcriptional regulator [Roseburia sp.]|nr:Crp/Fnr family transcriptional regulator [Roseburia sp.]